MSRSHIYLLPSHSQIVLALGQLRARRAVGFVGCGVSSETLSPRSRLKTRGNPASPTQGVQPRRDGVARSPALLATFTRSCQLRRRSTRFAVRARASLTSCSSLPAAACVSSCSQTRTTVQPASSSWLVVSISRRMLPSTFAAQNSAFVFATVWCSGQPCQKHPSTYTASRSRGNRMSAVRRTLPRGRRLTKKRSPRACKARLKSSSGTVSRPRLDFMLARTPGDDAHDGCSVMRSTLPARQPYPSHNEN